MVAAILFVDEGAANGPKEKAGMTKKNARARKEASFKEVDAVITVDSARAGMFRDVRDDPVFVGSKKTQELMLILYLKYI